MMLDPTISRARQKRLLEALWDQKLNAVAIGLPHHVYYLSAHLPNWLHQAGFVLLADGRSWLCAANKTVTNAAVDESEYYEAQWLATLRQEQAADVAEHIREFLKKNGCDRVGVDTSAVTSQVERVQVVDPILWQLRRRKDADELALLQRAIDCCRAMFERAGEMICPGVSEIDLFNELHAAAVRTAGEPMSALLGNDFTCGGGGGPPRNGRLAEAGELYVVDVGPCYRGYFADACRTFAVSKEPTCAQLEAAKHVQSCFEVIESLAKPDVRCRDIYDAVMKHLQKVAGKSFQHHLGHGVGLQPHEYPHLNPKWDDVLLEGEVFAAEPALYGPELRNGIRIENDYLVTATGVKRLLDSPMELV